MVAGKGPGSVAHPTRVAQQAARREPGQWRRGLAAVWACLNAAALEAAMAEGYRAMGELNLALVQEDEAALADWPDFDMGMPEADPSGDP